jgi:ABC-type protease/lipase transport system fused ATPase/permease subunit
MFIFSVAALLSLTLAAPALAQSQAANGTIEGTITDASGGVLPGVTVTITNLGTRTERTVITNEKGLYRAPLLPLGTYRVVAEIQGFKRFEQTAIPLSVGQTQVVNASLSIGQVNETITVTAADTPALDRAVDAAVLEPDVAALERGLDTLVGSRGVKLSGGQVQRAAAARMFVREAELLVFDDLSSALDAETEAELWMRLFARGSAAAPRTGNVTCLVVSHRPAALRRADQVLLMDGGRVIARGTLDELLTRSVEMQRLWQDAQDSREASVH